MWSEENYGVLFYKPSQVLKFTLWPEETGRKASDLAPSRRWHHPFPPRSGYVGSEIIVFWGLRS